MYVKVCNFIYCKTVCLLNTATFATISVNLFKLAVHLSREKVLLSSLIHQPNVTAKNAKISHYTDGQLNLQKFPLDNSASQQEFLVKQSEIL